MCANLFLILQFVEGKQIPTELKAEASQLRKKMKFDDTEREGTVHSTHLYVHYCHNHHESKPCKA